jgi:hypothetical protein
MEEIEFSKHALEQMAVRGIPVDIAKTIINNPQQVVTESGKKVYQSIITFDEGDYLVRLIVNTEKAPNLVITAYKTSKIDKYYEG